MTQDGTNRAVAVPPAPYDWVVEDAADSMRNSEDTGDDEDRGSRDDVDDGGARREARGCTNI